MNRHIVIQVGLIGCNIVIIQHNCYNSAEVTFSFLTNGKTEYFYCITSCETIKSITGVKNPYWKTTVNTLFVLSRFCMEALMCGTGPVHVIQRVSGALMCKIKASNKVTMDDVFDLHDCRQNIRSVHLWGAEIILPAQHPTPALARHMATTGCLRYNYVTLYSPLEINPLPSTTAHVHTRLVPLCTEDRTAARAAQIGDR